MSSLFNRRRFLEVFGGTSGLGLLASTPLGVIIDSAISEVYNQALAAESGAKYRRYLCIQQFGAPPRWMFDLFLNPFNDPKFVGTAGFGTRYTGSTVATGVEYALYKYKNIHVPWMWQFPVPKAGGGNRPMTELLDSMLHIRGVNTENPAHNASNQLRMHPRGARLSTLAIVGDVAQEPFSTIVANGTGYAYKSQKGRSITLTSANSKSNGIETLLNSFKDLSSESIKKRRKAVSAAMQQSLDAFDEFLQKEHPGTNLALQGRREAEKLMQLKFADLGKVWGELLAKYQDLIARAFSMQTVMKGINDKPIGISGTRDSRYELAVFGIVNNPDLRSLITPNTTVAEMAPLFALAEYIMMNDLSSSVMISFKRIQNLNFNGKNGEGHYDEHRMGVMPSLLLNTMQYRALAACLLELIDQFKVKGIYNDTVIEVHSEFNRTPRPNGTGSDHGFQAASATYYSGAVNEPMILGNILRTAPKPFNPGTWGYQAPIAELNGELLDHGHLLATLATLVCRRNKAYFRLFR